MAARTIPDKTRSRVLKLYESGATNRQIIDQTGVAPATIYWLLRQAGKEPDRRKAGTGTHDSDLVGRLIDRVAELEHALGRAEAERDMLLVESDRLRRELGPPNRTKRPS